MTREESKSFLIDISYKLGNMSVEYLTEKDGEKMREAIEALEQEPRDVFDEYGNYKYPSDVKLTEPNTATSMPCEDAIGREDALMCLTGEWTEITDEIIHRFIKRIKALPPVNPQPKTGKWIDSPNGYFTHCSECGLHGDKGIYKHYGWCPKCGARMIELQESENK